MLGDCAVKINDIVQEGVYDWFGNLNAKRKQWQNTRNNKDMVVVPNEVEQMFRDALSKTDVDINEVEPKILNAIIDEVEPKILNAIIAKGVSPADANNMVSNASKKIKIEIKYQAGMKDLAKKKVPPDEPENTAQSTAVPPGTPPNKPENTAQSTAVPPGTPPAAVPPVTPPEGTVILVTGPGGQDYFKSYKNVWYMKLGGPDDYSITHPMNHPASINGLNRLAAQSYKKIPVIPDPDIPNKFVLDRKARNAAIRTSRKQRMSK